MKKGGEAGKSEFGGFWAGVRENGGFVRVLAAGWLLGLFLILCEARQQSFLGIIPRKSCYLASLDEHLSLK